MYYFLPGRDYAWRCGVQHPFNLGWPYSTPWYGVGDGCCNANIRVKKKLQTCKPDSVSSRLHRGLLSFILSVHYCMDLSAYPPTRSENRPNGRAARRSWFTWHFSMQGLPPATITCCGRKLLPHVFTLTPPCHQFWGSYFLWHYLFPRFRETRLLAGALLYAVRTFLPDESER